jgi:hypothetical protein
MIAMLKEVFLGASEMAGGCIFGFCSEGATRDIFL